MTQYNFCNPRDLCEQMGVSMSYLRDRREGGDWKAGIHWLYLKPGVSRGGVRYNTNLCMHWFAVQGNEQAHQSAIDNYLKWLDYLVATPVN